MHVDNLIFPGRTVFVIVDIAAKKDNWNWWANLEKIWQSIIQFIDQQIPFDIRISKRLTHGKDSCLSYFENEHFLSQYKKPQCNNKFCLPRDKPLTTFDNKRGYSVLHLSNSQPAVMVDQIDPTHLF